MVVQDLRYAARTLSRSPAFTAVAVVTLALGIGANTAIFSVLYGVWLAPPPYPAGARLVDISMQELAGNRFLRGASWPDLADWKRESRVFEAFGEHRPNHESNVSAGGEAEELVTHRVSANLFEVMGVAPLLGPGFTPDADTASGPRLAILSYGYWQRRFAGDRAAIGRRIEVEGEGFKISGVMPPRFEFPFFYGRSSPALWLSLNIPAEQLNGRNRRAVDVVGRLRRGVPMQQAQSEMAAMVGRLAAAYPKENGGWGVVVSRLEQTRAGMEAKPALLLLTGAAGLVLLVACVNLANLVLARAAGRERELAIRRALGATRLRLVGQLMAESWVLALAGGLAGVLLAWWSLPLLKGLLPAGMPRVNEISVNGRVLAFAAAVSLVTSMLFGVAPAWRAAGPRRFARQRPARVLVMAEVALAMVLLAAAGLLIESFWRISRVDMGFDREHVLTMRLQLNSRRYNTGQRVEAFREELLRRAAALRGVERYGTVSTLPLGLLMANMDFEAEGHNDSAHWAAVSSGYLRAMGIPLVNGRYFDERDRPGAAPVTIVSQSLARRYWPEGQAVGRRIRFDANWFRIVGVVKDVREDRPDGRPAACIYALSQQLSERLQSGINGRFIVLVLRTAEDPAVIGAAVRRAVSEIDKDQPVADIQTMQQRVSRVLAGRRLNMILLAIFAGLGLTLAAVGVFGVVSYSVARRTSEIGIRMALGARPWTVMAMVARETLLLGLAGAAVGMAGTFAVSRLLAGFLYGVAPTEPRTIAGVVALLVAIVVASGLGPARRAMRMDPAVSLRESN